MRRPIILSALFLFFFLIFPKPSPAQRLELNGGYAHATGDLGLDGFHVGAAWWFTPRVTMAADFDGLFDTSKVGVFDLSSVGTVSVKSNMQNYLIGPRIFFPRVGKRYPRLVPFGELQFGATHLHSTIHQVNLPDESAADSAFTWMVGGGADYLLQQHWAARVNLDLVRTHLAEQGQSRFRFGVGIVYTFGSRNP
ncbi:MAG: outer membrane beta-barrel protein [Acidobacteria bacterium]|nr:outer membrane beta-barrel protein [Acidobacteriota bacterium]